MAQLAMPIPAATEGDGLTSVVLALFCQLHEQVREEVSGLDTNALNWVPVSGANSIATIVVHLLGSEEETLRTVAGLSSERDRDAEFAGEGSTIEEVLGLLEEADQFVRAVMPRIDVERLESPIALPTLPPGETRSGMTWLVGNYGHAREHLGHIQLTKQLFEGRGSTVLGQGGTPEQPP
jgi:DinB superfamily